MEEKEKEREKREQDLKENLHKRKQQAHNMQKRTRRGQPLMKYQIVIPSISLITQLSGGGRL